MNIKSKFGTKPKHINVGHAVLPCSALLGAPAARGKCNPECPGLHPARNVLWNSSCKAKMEWENLRLHSRDFRAEPKMTRGVPSLLLHTEDVEGNSSLA